MGRSLRAWVSYAQEQSGSLEDTGELLSMGILFGVEMREDEIDYIHIIFGNSLSGTYIV